MTDFSHSTTTSEAKFAELMALGHFDWIIGDPDTEGATAADWADEEAIIASTQATYADEIDALRAEIAGPLEPARVTFHLAADGEPWACTDLRSEARRRG